MKKRSALFVALFVTLSHVSAVELVLGEERIEPGALFIFEGAIKDSITPQSRHLQEDETHVHIEARVNWDADDFPKGAPAGGFVPYLHITAKVTSQTTGLSTFIDLLPHMNLVDNFHYARNMTLSGAIDDLYTVTFSITPPAGTELALHKDWVDRYGNRLMTGTQFTYKNVQFKDIVRAERR